MSPTQSKGHEPPEPNYDSATEAGTSPADIPALADRLEQNLPLRWGGIADAWAKEENIKAVIAALRKHAEREYLKAAVPVMVDCEQYRGPGVTSNKTHFGSHLVWLDHTGMNYAVELPNGNVWLYPVDSVTPTK